MDDPQLLILLSPLPRHWNRRSVPPCLADTPLKYTPPRAGLAGNRRSVGSHHPQSTVVQAVVFVLSYKVANEACSPFPTPPPQTPAAHTHHCRPLALFSGVNSAPTPFSSQFSLEIKGREKILRVQAPLIACGSLPCALCSQEVGSAERNPEDMVIPPGRGTWPGKENSLFLSFKIDFYF